MAFFIMKKKSFTLLIFISFIISFYNYDYDDWFYIIDPQNIKSITQDSFNIHFLAENGIFSYDLITEDFFYNINLSFDLSDDKKYLIHYEKSNDYFFILTKKYILYKSSVSSYWNEKRLSDFNIPSINSVKNIGFNSQYIFIESKNNYKIIDIFSMTYDTQNNIEGYSNINWINNDLSSLDLTDFYTFGDDRISKNYIFDEAGIDHYVTSSIYDKYDNLWIGMNTGAIYKVEDSSYEINRLNIGPRLDFISNIFNDQDGNWYFMDNYFKRTGEIDSGFNGYILSIWNENDNSWEHIPKNDNMLLNDITINSINKYEKYIILATFDGLIIYDTENKYWFHNNKFLNATNRVVWDLDFYYDKIYLSTNNGVVECNFTISNGKFKIYYNDKMFSNSEIYDLKIYNDELFFATSEGLFNYNVELDEITIIDSKVYYNIEIFDTHILGSNKNLWYIDDSGRELISNRIEDFNVSDDKDRVCGKNRSEIIIIDLKTKNEWSISLNDIGKSNFIYTIDCDNDWLWFSSDFGVSYFKWSNYEK